ncbi:uncharacterized protein LOC126267360 [Schistocerca gregaria]|uniref:uncharacterized protein LOC126267360 n=1 Tax=Schistocerca gregaria TaxID=7010 RepID=UPI00211E313F|nr:uncharacterized protein LOC126267360 [Schistocerca gregaria]
MTLKFPWIFLIVVCCGLSNAADNRMNMCVFNCQTTVRLIISRNLKMINSSNVKEATPAEKLFGNNDAISSDSPFAQNHLCTGFCRYMFPEQFQPVQVNLGPQELNAGFAGLNADEIESVARARKWRAAGKGKGTRRKRIQPKRGKTGGL